MAQRCGRDRDRLPPQQHGPLWPLPGMSVGAQPMTVRASQTGALERLPVDIRAVVDTQDVNSPYLVVYAVQQPVGPAPSAEGPCQLALKALANSSRLASQLAVGELDDGRQDPRWDAVQVPPGRRGEADLVGHVARSLRALWHA